MEGVQQRGRPDDVPRRVWDLWKRADDGLIEMYDSQARKHRLNHSGTVIWDLVDGKRTIAEIAGCVAEQCAGSEGATQSTRDGVIELLDHLVRLGMISYAESSLWKTG